MKNLFVRHLSRSGFAWIFYGLTVAQSTWAGILTNGVVQPKNGDLSTVFQFRVTYLGQAVGNLPSAVQLILDETATNLMSAADPADLDPRDGKVYVWSGTLPKARHRFRFATLPASTGDLSRHWGPDVSDAPLLVRQFYFFLDCPADYLADDFYVGRDSRFISGGDLNGDGYADLVHAWYGATIQGEPNEGAVMVYYGPDFVRHDVLLHPRYPAHELFGNSVAAGGDIDGDGCDDLVVSNFSGARRRLFVYHGRKSGPPVLAGEIQASSSEDLRALVDVNQDGYADLVTQGSVVTVSPPDYTTTLLRVRRGPALSASFESTLGISGHQTFNGMLSITDRNGDGFPDLVVHGPQRAYSMSSTSFTYYASSGSEQIRVADGPALSAAVLQTHDYPWAMLAIGDADGDGRGDFASGNDIHTSVDWHGGPDLALRGSVALPNISGNYWLGYFGAGNGAGSGRTSLALLQYNSDNQGQRGVQYYWGPPASPFSSRVFLPAPLVGNLNWSFERPYWGPAHDTDGNGLEDFFVAGVGGPEAPLDQLAAMTLGTVLVGSPCYPLPLSEADLPARFRARLAGCTLNLGPLGEMPLSPNGSLEFIAGTADTNHLAPLIILAGSLQLPDKAIGSTDRGEVILLRVQAVGEDGSGHIYAAGPKKGQGQLQLWISTQFIQKGAAETVIASDRMLAKVDLDPPLDLATGYGRLVCRGQMQELLGGLSIAAEGASLTLAGYVEYVRPTESPFLVRVPARVDFGGVGLGSSIPPRRITLCNLGEMPLRITGLTLPGSPFRITGVPALPAIVNPTSALVLTAEFLPAAPGYHEAVLRVTSDDPAHPTLVVNLTGSALPAGEQDSDGDGLPDSFEARYRNPTTSNISGLSTNLLDGHLDNDRDGASNLAEYFAGTDPTNPKSVFKLIQPRHLAGTGAQFGWLSSTGKTYSVCRSTNASADYLPLQTGILGNGATNTFIDTSATNRQKAFFYRVRLE